MEESERAQKETEETLSTRGSKELSHTEQSKLHIMLWHGFKQSRDKSNYCSKIKSCNNTYK